MFTKSFNSTFKLNFRKEISRSLAIAMIGASLTAAQSVPASATVITINCPAGGSYTITDGVVGNGGTCAGKVIIDARATSIGAGAFWTPDSSDGYNPNLISMYTGDNVISIGKEAFRATNNLETIVMGNKTTSISEFAFYNSTRLRRVTTGRSLATIGDSAFYGVNYLVITLPQSIVSIGSGLAYFGNRQQELPNWPSIAYHCGTFPSSSTGSYHGLNQVQFCLDSVDLGTSGSDVTLRGTGFINGDVIDFGGETRTAVVSDGGTVATLDTPYISRGAANFLRITHADGGWAETSSPVLPCYTVIGNELASGASCAGNLTIPEGIETITAEAFKNNSALTGVSFPSTLRHIDDFAFEGADLRTVAIPDGVLTMGSGAFKENGDTAGVPRLETVTIGNGLTVVPDDAFMLNESLTFLTLGSNVERIKAQAFFRTALISVEIPDSVTQIDDRAFAFSGLTSVLFGENSDLASIGDSAFTSSNLSSIMIPDSVTSIGKESFANNSSLLAVAFGRGSTLTSIGELAFAGTSLIEIDFPNSLSSIGLNVFGITPILSLEDVYYCHNNYVRDYDDDTTAGSWLSKRSQRCVDGDKLTSLRLSAGTIGTFSTETLTYSAIVGNNVTSSEVTWSLNDPLSEVSYPLGSESLTVLVGETTTTIMLSEGMNRFEVKIKAPGFESTYSIDITRVPSPSFATRYRDYRFISVVEPATFNSVASSSDGNKLVSATSDGVIKRSVNGGRTWLDSFTLPESESVRNVVSSASGANLIAATQGSDDAPGKVYYSGDSGSTWQPSRIDWSTESDKSVYRVVISANGQHVAFLNNSKIFISVDGGASFSLSRIATVDGSPRDALPMNPDRIAISGNGQILFASEWTSLYKSSDGGVSWVSVDLGAPALQDGVAVDGSPFESIWISSSGARVLIAAQGDAIISSSDGGNLWKRLDVYTALPLVPFDPEEPEGDQVPNTNFCEATSSDDGVRILVSMCSPGNFSISFDSGALWEGSPVDVSQWKTFITSDGSSIITTYYDLPKPGGVGTFSAIAKGNYSALSTSSGPVSGGSEVIIYGFNFASDSVFTVGGKVATITGSDSIGPLYVRVISTPAHPAGIVDITVTNSDGGSKTLTGAFTYIDPPVVVTVASGVNVVETIPVASENSPVISTFSTLGGTFSAQIPNGTGSLTQKVTVVVAVNTVTEATKFSLSPVAAGLDSESGLAIFKLTASLMGGASVSTFAKPLEITVPAGLTGSSAAWSIDGLAWSTIPQLTSKLLPEGQEDGYFINPNGSFTLLTRHLTIFGFRKSQDAFSLTGDAKEIQAGKSAQIATLGGSGSGSLAYASLTTSICSVNTAGLVVGNSAGTCLLKATKAASRRYMDATANLSIQILAAAPKDVVAPADTKTKASAQSALLKVKALSKNRSSFAINLSNKFAGERLIIEVHTKMKKKIKVIVIAKILLDKSGDAKYIAERILPKYSIVKLKVGSRYVTSLTV